MTQPGGSHRAIGFVVAFLILTALTLAGVSEELKLLPIGLIVISFVGFFISYAIGAIFNWLLIARCFGWVCVLSILSLFFAGIVIAFQESATEPVATSLAKSIETHRVAHGE